MTVLYAVPPPPPALSVEALGGQRGHAAQQTAMAANARSFEWLTSLLQGSVTVVPAAVLRRATATSAAQRRPAR